MRSSRRTAVRSIGSALGILWLGGCAGASSLPVRGLPSLPPISTPGVGGIAAVEREVHARINEYRVSRGLQPLEHREELARLAREHSEAVAARRRPFGHDAFDERSDAAARFVALRSFAENIAQNGGLDPASTAVDGWLRSPGHRRNIEGAYDLTGIGVALAPDGSYTLTQIFVGSR